MPRNKQEPLDSDEFLAAVTQLVKEMHFYGRMHIHTPSSLDADKALRLEIMMGNIDAVKEALASGANLDYSFKGVSNRELAQAYKNKTIQAFIKDYLSKKSLMRKKNKPYSET